MREQVATTPFGRRAVTLGQIAARLQAEEAIQGAAAPGSNQPAAVHKWKLFRIITEAKAEIGVSDRALGVLNALLTFHPEMALSLPASSPGAGANAAGEGEGGETSLVVFPSNRELSLRAHGVGERSLARHLGSLVGAGLILRRDSPNGKRYARKARGGGGGFSEAFGFDLTPLVLRALEFEEIAERLRRERQRLQALRERISLHRRDIAKMIACGLDEGVEGDWDGYAQALLGFCGPLRRVHDGASLASLENELAKLRAKITGAIAAHLHSHQASAPAASDRAAQGPARDESPPESDQESGNDGQTDGHHHNSNTQSQNLEPASKKARAKPAETPDEPSHPPFDETPKRKPNGEGRAKSSRAGTPLGMVLDACPDIGDWAPDGLRSWPDFLSAARLARAALGISPSAWREAIEAMGEIDAAIAVASILQRHESSSDALTSPSPSGGPPQTTVNGAPAIASAGGYLRALTDKARTGEFAIGPILMALIGQRGKKQLERMKRAALNIRVPRRAVE